MELFYEPKLAPGHGTRKVEAHLCNDPDCVARRLKGHFGDESTVDSRSRSSRSSAPPRPARQFASIQVSRTEPDPVWLVIYNGHMEIWREEPKDVKGSVYVGNHQLTLVNNKLVDEFVTFTGWRIRL